MENTGLRFLFRSWWTQSSLRVRAKPSPSILDYLRLVVVARRPRIYWYRLFKKNFLPPTHYLDMEFESTFTYWWFCAGDFPIGFCRSTPTLGVTFSKPSTVGFDVYSSRAVFTDRSDFWCLRIYYVLHLYYSSTNVTNYQFADDIAETRSDRNKEIIKRLC